MNAQVINHGMHGLLQTANLLRGFHIKKILEMVIDLDISFSGWLR